MSSPITHNITLIRWLTYMMFMMFAMTTDAVGVIIPVIIKEFGIGMTQAGLFHSGPMATIAIAGLFLGFLADKLGRKKTICLGLALFAITSFCFLLGQNFAFFLTLVMLAGLAIGIFKTAALALIGDISRSTREHTSTMNGVEAFFGVGAIIGPALVTYMLVQGVDWKWLYVIAGGLCTLLIVVATRVDYPQTMSKPDEPIDIRRTMRMMKDPHLLFFSAGAFLYVAAEAAIYVWMPTYLIGYDGSATFIFTWSLTIFFVLRAAGRFLGMWMMGRFNWAWVMVLFSGAILLCFLFSIALGKNVAVFLLPLSGIFMSIIYPTINSKGISCFAKNQHGTVAGVILFFTALGAALGPLIMGVVGDAFGGDAKYGFIVATVFAAILFVGLVYNLIFSPVKQRLAEIEAQEYSTV